MKRSTILLSLLILILASIQVYNNLGNPSNDNFNPKGDGTAMFSEDTLDSTWKNIDGYPITIEKRFSEQEVISLINKLKKEEDEKKDSSDELFADSNLMLFIKLGISLVILFPALFVASSKKYSDKQITWAVDSIKLIAAFWIGSSV